MSLEDEIRKLTESIRLLSIRVSLLESNKIEIRQRNFKWQKKIIYVIENNGVPISKKDILKRVMSIYPDLRQEPTEAIVRKRLSSSYAKMIKDKKIVLVNPNIKGMPKLLAMRSWFDENNGKYRTTQEWFMTNDDYEYIR